MIYGVDLGTSNCLIAKFNNKKNNNPLECLKDSLGRNNFPSVVHFKDENDVLIGELAKDMLDELPDQTIELVKVRIGKEKEINYVFNGEEREISPQSLTALFLNHFKRIHQTEDIKKVVLTVPAYFDDSQKSATKQAAELSDMEVVELIEEPSAAIMYFFYSLYHKQKIKNLNDYINKNYLVFDFGGGTLDLSLINIGVDSKNHISPEVILKDGSNKIGGSDIDFYFTQWLLEFLNDIYEGDSFLNVALKVLIYYYKKYRFPDKTQPEIKRFILSLKKLAERTKIELSDKHETSIEFPNSEKYENEIITRKDFEDEVLMKYFRKPILETLKRVRNKASHKSLKIDEIVLVGGSAKIPYIQRIIKEIFPNIQIKSMDEKELAVSKGGAIIGAIRSGQLIEPFGANKSHSCVSHDLYIEQKGQKPIKIVDKGTKIPFEPIHKSFSITHALRTKIDIVVKEIYEQNSIEERDNNSLQENIVKEISFYHPFFYTGENIDVIFDTDDLGLWNMKVIHKETNESIEFEAEKHTLLGGEAFKLAKARISNINILNE